MFFNKSISKIKIKLDISPPFLKFSILFSSVSLRLAKTVKRTEGGEKWGGHKKAATEQLSLLSLFVILSHLWVVHNLFL